MKQKFSTSWKASKHPRKQRKYLANAPLHIKRKLLSVNLSKELRKKYGKRNIPVRKGDKVKIMRGKFKNKSGKITEVRTKMMKIYLEGIQVKKTDGSKVSVPLRASNLQIIELNLDDAKRLKKLNEEKKEIREKKMDEKNSVKKEIEKQKPKKESIKETTKKNVKIKKIKEKK
jgi:large subunit ribosomal protein L24